MRRGHNRHGSRVRGPCAPLVHHRLEQGVAQSFSLVDTTKSAVAGLQPLRFSPAPCDGVESSNDETPSQNANHTTDTQVSQTHL